MLFSQVSCISIKWDLGALESVIPEINQDVDTLLDVIKRFLSTLSSMPDSTLLYAASNIGNKVTNRSFASNWDTKYICAIDY